MGIPIKKPTVASDPILDLLPPGLPPSLPLHLPQPPSICAQTLDREWRRELSNIRRSSRSSLPPSQSLKGLTKKYLAFRSRSFRVVAHPGRGRSYASSKSSLLTRSGFSTGTSASMSMGPSRSIAACGSNLLQVGKLRSWLHVRVEAAGFDAGSDLLCEDLIIRGSNDGSNGNDTEEATSTLRVCVTV